MTTFPKETYIARRRALRDAVPEGGLLLFLGNEESGMNYEDNTYTFRQDSTFLYFFGLDQASLAAVIDLDEDREIIFGNELTIDDIVWMGTLPTLRENASKVGVTQTMPMPSLPGYLSRAAGSGRKIHYLPPYRPEHTLKLSEWLGLNPAAVKAGASVEFIKGVVNLRNHKTGEEIVEIEKAVDISAEMHLQMYRMVRPGMTEKEVDAAVTAIALSRGAGISFPVIATVNGQTLHNHIHPNTLKEGQMFLLDAGAETGSHYCGDLSSTAPVGRHFTQQQRVIYDICLAGHQAAVKMLRPGIPFRDIHLHAASVIAEGLKNIGLMKGDPVEAAHAGAHALFFPCGLGHMMGLDVHDMENLGEVWVGYDGQPKSTLFGIKSLRLARPLEPGFVLTIEPGIYFIPELIDLWRSENRFSGFLCWDEIERFRDFGGLRNEEDYLITPDGARRLGKYIPTTIDEVEAMKN